MTQAWGLTGRVWKIDIGFMIGLDLDTVRTEAGVTIAHDMPHPGVTVYVGLLCFFAKLVVQYCNCPQLNVSAFKVGPNGELIPTTLEEITTPTEGASANDGPKTGGGGSGNA